MTDNRAIGVFDSGLGGLTTVRELRRIMPNEDIVYFGDTGRVPYGTRSRETVRKYARQDIRFLLSRDVKMIVVACNTAAAAIADEMEGYGIPYADALTPAVAAAAGATRNKTVAVIGTAATVKSGAYEAAIHAVSPGIRVVAASCPLFVPLVENGFSGKDNPVAHMVAEQYLLPVMQSGADTLILGCTHYPVMKDIIEDIVGTGVTLVDSGQEAARRAREKLEETGRLSSGKTEGSCRYYVSDSPADFAESAQAILGGPIEGGAEQVDIESYEAGSELWKEEK